MLFGFLMTKIAHAKVTTRKQVSIPKKIQEELGGINEGDYLIFSKEKDRIYITKGVVKEI